MMKNQAKCKICKSIIESFHATDYVSCKCGEITVDGGDALRCSAKNWENFFRIDDKGNEISVTVKNMSTDIESYTSNSSDNLPTRKELIGMLDGVIVGYENLPSHAMSEPINHYDFLSALLLISAIMKAKD